MTGIQGNHKARKKRGNICNCSSIKLNTKLDCVTFPFHLSIIRFGPVWRWFVGGFGWLEPQTDYLSFVGTAWSFQWAPRPSSAVDVWWASSLGISSNSSVFRLPYSWVRLFKTLLNEEPLPHPNRIANSIWPFSGLLGWD